MCLGEALGGHAVYAVDHRSLDGANTTVIGIGALHNVISGLRAEDVDDNESAMRPHERISRHIIRPVESVDLRSVFDATASNKSIKQLWIDKTIHSEVSAVEYGS